MPIVIALGLLALAYLFTGLRQINQWEVALRFTLGKLSGRSGAGGSPSSCPASSSSSASTRAPRTATSCGRW